MKADVQKGAGEIKRKTELCSVRSLMFHRTDEITSASRTAVDQRWSRCGMNTTTRTGETPSLHIGIFSFLEFSICADRVYLPVAPKAGLNGRTSSSRRSSNDTLTSGCRSHHTFLDSAWDRSGPFGSIQNVSMTADEALWC